jgi:molybdenum cofactor cytidylyltransferase
MKKVIGLILAAGKSERMGSAKSLLRIQGKSFLEHIVIEAQQSALSDFKIVLGHQAEQVLKSLPQLRSAVVLNADYDQGQLSSLIKGLQSIKESSVDGVMLFLVDHPFVTHRLIDSLLQQFSRQSAPIVIPSYHGRRGHPMIFSRQLFPELLAAPLDQGAAAVVRRHQPEILHLDTEEEGVLIDVDTPEAYREYVIGRGFP